MKYLTINEVQLKELLLSFYHTGGWDEKDDSFYWCDQGGTERVEELLPEMLDDLGVEFYEQL